MNIFKQKRMPPPTYREPLEAAEIIQLFGQLTLHQQAALDAPHEPQPRHQNRQ